MQEKVVVFLFFSEAVGSGRDDNQEMKLKILKLEEALNLTRFQVQKLKIELQTQKKAMENLTVQVNICSVQCLVWKSMKHENFSSSSFSRNKAAAAALVHQALQAHAAKQDRLAHQGPGDPLALWVPMVQLDQRVLEV